MKLIKYQQGGPMADPNATAPQEMVPAGQGGAEEQMAQIAQELVQTLLQQLGDPNAVAAILQMAMEMLSQAVGGQQGEPMFKKGGKLVKTKKACGGASLKK